MRRYLSLFMATALGACTVGPDYAPAPVPDGADGALVEATSSQTSPTEAPDAWWRLYDDATLVSLVEEALIANQDIHRAEANLAGARALYLAARSSLYPKTEIGLGAVYGRNANTDEILELSGKKPKTIWLFDDRLDVSYELDLFGHVRRSMEAAAAGAESSVAQRDAVRVTVVDAAAFWPWVVVGQAPPKLEAIPAAKLLPFIELSERNRIQPQPIAVDVDRRTANGLAVPITDLRRGFDEDNRFSSTRTRVLRRHRPYSFENWPPRYRRAHQDEQH